MQAKNPRMLKLRVSWLAILLLALSACATPLPAAPFPAAPLPAASRILATPLEPVSPVVQTSPTTVHSPLPTQPPATRLAPQVQAAVFDVSATNFRQNEDKLLVDVCFNLPDTQDWMLDRATVQIGGLQIDQDSGELLEYQAAKASGQIGKRCDTIFFDVPVGTQPSEAVLNIDSLSSPPREGQYCAFLLNTVQTLLDQQGAGIKLECTEQPGGSAAKVVSKPAHLSQAEAEAIAFSTDYYRVDGPWQFTAPAVPTVTPYPTVALEDPNASPYALLLTLNQKADANLVYPGWVYTRENWQHDVDPANYRTLVDGVPLPKETQRETWARLDETGRVIQSVSLLYGPDGQTLETNITTQGTYHSSSSSEPYPQQPYQFHLNEPYFGNVQANLERGNGSASQGELDGQVVIIFTIKEDYLTDDPALYNQPIVGDEVSIFLSADTGQLKMLKTVAKLADGSQRTLEFMRLLTLSGMEPPPSVLEILANANTG